MSAAEALRIAHRAGVAVILDGDDLLLRAEAEPPAAILDALLEHKPDIVTLLRPDAGGWSVEDWQVFHDERAGVAEFDAGPLRPEAEEHAFACSVAEWLHRNPVRSFPGRCLSCGRAEHAEDPLLPFGTEGNGHVWLHSRCWPGWRDAREADAVSGLASMGLHRPRTPG